ncbi:hypothetical protein [Kribbella sp. ALI-6-A]|uniref:hypothetical protein n=1 Tax=Kribbella sp. ALI-6-A TaxID=1933817 RepID=UPI001EDBE7DE|nr:hypothetical protein [Kribbella sp. ALI-6-A]
MTDYTRPLLLGYILKHLLMTAGELAKTKDRLGAFAQVDGFTMGTIYVENPDTTPAAFEALVDAVIRYEATAVVVPSLIHLVAPGFTHDIKATLRAGHRCSRPDPPRPTPPLIWRSRRRSSSLTWVDLTAQGIGSVTTRPCPSHPEFPCSP